MESSPLLLAFVSDLIFASKIEETARRKNYQVMWMDGGALGRIDESIQASANNLAEPLEGPLADLIDQISSNYPALIIIDLNDQTSHWQSWLSRLKSIPATRRIPILGYGSHVDAVSLTQARQAGADGVVARSKFASDLPELLEKYALIPDQQQIREACATPLSALAVHGLELFNRGEYFEAHEELELAWRADETPGRELYQAVLQVAVAYLQIERGNYNGAVKMFWRVRQWITPLPGECRGVNVAMLKQDAEVAYQALKSLGKERIGEFDQALFHSVQYQID